jgi:hypothetical protein
MIRSYRPCRTFRIEAFDGTSIALGATCKLQARQFFNIMRPELEIKSIEEIVPDMEDLPD